MRSGTTQAPAAVLLAPTEVVRRGQILSYWKSRKYGYIVPFEKTDADDYFFHLSNCSPDSEEPARGRECEFSLGLYKGRVKAVYVRVLPEAEETHGVITNESRQDPQKIKKTMPQRAWTSDDGGDQ